MSTLRKTKLAGDSLGSLKARFGNLARSLPRRFKHWLRRLRGSARGKRRLRRVLHFELNPLRDFLALQESGQSQTTVDSRTDAGGRDQIAVDDHARVFRDRAEIRQQVKGVPVCGRASAATAVRRRPRSAHRCRPKECSGPWRRAPATTRGSPRLPSTALGPARLGQAAPPGNPARSRSLRRA